jgi:hypothetical protein
LGLVGRFKEGSKRMREEGGEGRKEECKKKESQEKREEERERLVAEVTVAGLGLGPNLGLTPSRLDSLCSRTSFQTPPSSSSNTHTRGRAVLLDCPRKHSGQSHSFFRIHIFFFGLPF